MKDKDRTLVNKTCKYCGKDFVVEKFRRGLFCNRSCANNYRYKDQKTPNAICSNCGDRFYVKQSQLKKVKTPCCSMRCSANIKKTIYTGSKNPNYKGKQYDYDGYRLYVPQASTVNFGRMNDIDPVVERVREKLRLRSNTGIKKYGRTMDREDLDTVAWLRHAQDESLDLAIYLERLIANYRLESNDGR